MTARQLLWMSDGYDEDRWAHTSAILAYVANGYSKKKLQPDDINPTKQGKRSDVVYVEKGNKESISEMRTAFKGMKKDQKKQ